VIRIYPEIKGLIFDCDGTLADTMPIHIEAWENAFSAFNVTCPLYDNIFEFTFLY